MRQRRVGNAASVVSLGLSLSLAAVLLVMATSADPARPPERLERYPAEVSEPVASRPEPDLGAVFLPPPPQVAPVPEAAAVPPVQPASPPEPPPTPAVEQAVIPEGAPEPQSEPLPEPIPQPPAEPQVTTRPSPPSPSQVEITPAAIREGRALLRLLERGKGPDIEIAWPAGAAARSDLYRLFSQCFGMRTVVMAADGAIFDTDSGRLTAGAFDADRYSGFVRRPAGRLSTGEQAQVDAVHRRHGLAGGQVLRLFPRRVDAVLLGALHRIAGDAFDDGVRIRARYRAATGGVHVGDIEVDGRAANEIIVLPFTAQRACGPR